MAETCVLAQSVNDCNRKMDNDQALKIEKKSSDKSRLSLPKAKSNRYLSTSSLIRETPGKYSRYSDSKIFSRVLSSITTLYFKNEKDESDKEKRRAHLWELMSSYLSTDVEDIEQFIVNHVEYTLARSRLNFDDHAAFQATALSLRDRLIETWNDTQQCYIDKQVKRVYYFSIEYLLGRALCNTISNLDLKSQYAQALYNIGYALEDLYDQEVDAGLGNGGLGRLAACFLDSLATLNYPAWGYGIRYRYGMFKQDIHNGVQVETPDYWLNKGWPWEIQRTDVVYTIRFGGYVTMNVDAHGNLQFRWEGGELVDAQAYDVPIPGYKTTNTNNLRLWTSRPNNEFDLDLFNEGDYYGALKAKQQSENITGVLYPNDRTTEGRELRLKQQYFFVSASLRDIIRTYRITFPDDTKFSQLGSRIALQLNDTHPALAIPELMRLLMDREGLGWDEAWKITTETFAYTNHTILPEALEKWPVPFFERLLPRHLQIIYEINRRFLEEVAKKWPGDVGRLQRLSLIEESNPKAIRMANLSIVGSHSINGVAEIHTKILKEVVFRDFYELWPQKFNNKTNGVTPRRWLLNANPYLSDLITKTLKTSDWVTKLELISKLKSKATDSVFQKQFLEVKLQNKRRLAQIIRLVTNGALEVNPEALFDVHVKRIHEYKRQLLNILGVIHRYQWIKSMSPEQRQKVTPRVVIFGGKAAPAYVAAKAIIKLINSVADVVNRDNTVNKFLQVVFIPNYNVSLAEVIIPASDISQHISTAGTEASGTSNMKFAMNGGLILGTLDGANIEMCEEIGAENMFIFGTRAEHVPEVRKLGPRPIDNRLHDVLMLIHAGTFGDPQQFAFLFTHIWSGDDHYLVAQDFPSYLDAQQAIDETFQNKKLWSQKCINTVAGMAKFSSDRTIQEYARDIWGVEPCPLPAQQTVVYHK